MSSTDRSSSPYTRRNSGQDCETSQNLSNRSSSEEPSKKKTARKKKDDDMSPFADCGRFLMQCVYPFIVVDTLVVVAQEQTSPGTDEIKERYEGYATAALTFSEDLQMRLSWGDTSVPDINAALVRGMRAGRSADIHRLKNNTGRLASKTDTPLALVGDTKSDRGFANDTLGQMLVPIQHLKAYTNNPVESKRARGVVGYEVTGGDPPAFLYKDLENYDPTNLLFGFMRGYFLPHCLHAIFTGPRTAMQVPSPNDRPARDSVAKLCKVETVTVPIIVYVAMLAQFTLSSQPAWSGQDGKFDYQDFVDMLFQVFKHDDIWTEQTIRWWNVELFGNENGLRSAGSAKGVTSGFLAMVKDQSKDRCTEKEVPEQMPFIGGVLVSRPQDYRPDRFSHPFWAEDPYFLPCLVALTAAYALVSFFVTAVYLEEPYSKGPVREGQSGHGVAEEECEPGPEAGPREVAAAARAAHEAGPGVGIQLRAARHGRHNVHPARLGDAGRPWRARPQPGAHWPVVSGYGCLDGLIQFSFFPHVVLKQNRKARSRNHHVGGF
ncbi:hypothetical protein EDB89DRAFT_2232445, partial [Lactarius sanguifluus]